MKEKHYIDDLSAFVNQELSKDERQAIAEHLLQCEKCRKEHDRVKLGVSLASRLQQADAPADVWASIENTLDGRRAPQFSPIPKYSFFTARNVFASAAAILVVSTLTFVVYTSLFQSDGQTTAKKEPNIEENNAASTAAPTNARKPPADTSANAQPSETNSNIASAPVPATANAFWPVETIAGNPKVGNKGEVDKLTVGDVLETDANSRARIEVANIGNVEIAPNSRVRLLNTTSVEHRLSLDRGSLHAKILAPPRLFIVDTPSAAAVDLGCEYTLEVDKDGNSKLNVLSGYVALERNGRESIVAAGMSCLTRRGKGLGTPFSTESSASFQAAVMRFDFEGGGREALQTIIKESGFYDMFTLWHLLSRVPKNDREEVYDALAKYVKPPAGVTREGVSRLDKVMLDAWRKEVETAWYE